MRLNARLAARSLECLDEGDLRCSFDMHMACMQLVCDKLGLALHFEKTCSFGKILPGGVDLELHTEFVDGVVDGRYSAEVFALNRRLVPEQLLVFSKEEVETEEDLLEKFSSELTDPGLVEPSSELSKLLESPPLLSRGSHVDDVYKLSVMHVLEDVFTSGSYWIAAHSGYDTVKEKQVFRVLEGVFPRFCCRPEFDMKVVVNGAPKFKEVTL